MRLEYFQLIDRITALDLEGRKIEAKATVPTTSTIFEGHFPGYPLMPGVLLLETMAQASGWLIIGLTGFTRMPFLAAFKEAKLRSFVTPGRSSRTSSCFGRCGAPRTPSRLTTRASTWLICVTSSRPSPRVPAIS